MDAWLEELVAVMAEQIAVAAESLAQMHDDLFIETCAEWVVPYIGDLIGYESLHSVVPAVASPRAEVAHTIALRRRKGTALVLEQLARDVTGWDAKAVEYFQRVIENLKRRGAEAVVLGCTEIPLVMSDANSPLPTLDSTRLLARAALQRAARKLQA